MNPQLAGVEAIAGTYVFDLRVSHRALKLNRFFWQMIGKPWRERFEADAEQLMTEAGLSEEEKRLVRTQDWIGLIRYGANFFVLEKFARVAKKTNLEVYASMRGEGFEDFMKTRSGTRRAIRFGCATTTQVDRIERGPFRALPARQPSTGEEAQRRTRRE